jgi:hypothetical protein
MLVAFFVYLATVIGACDGDGGVAFHPQYEAVCNANWFPLYVMVVTIGSVLIACRGVFLACSRRSWRPVTLCVAAPIAAAFLPFVPLWAAS